RTEHRRLQVRVAVAVMPSLLMAIVAAGREQLVEHGRQVLLETRLEFDGTDGGGAADVEYMNHAGEDARLGNNSGHVLGQVVHLAMAGGLEVDLMLDQNGLQRLLDGLLRVKNDEVLQRVRIL